MRYLILMAVFAVMFAAAFHVNAQNWQIVPGASVGPITASTSETELIKIFGKANVKQTQVDVGEGEVQAGTVIFPNDPTKKASILWSDPDTRLRPASVTITGKKTVWKTDSGITIGTPLSKIEELNGKPFAMTGFAWDYEGTVMHANGGKLSALGTESDEEITGRTLLLRLSPAAKFHKTAEYKSVMGDGKFFSDNPAMKKLNPTVYEMIIEFAQ